MNWTSDERWIAHASAELSYAISKPETKYQAVVYERIGNSTQHSIIGDFDTLEEAKDACETTFAAESAKRKP
jgi:hypothetical protein